MRISKFCRPALLGCALVALVVLNASAQEPKSQATPTKKFIPVGSKVYVAPMKDGFDTYVIAGIMKKQVPVVVVNSREKADYEITGIAESDKAGWAKMLFLGSSSSAEQASIKIVEIKSEEVIFGYSVKQGQLSAREAKRGRGLRQAHEREHRAQLATANRNIRSGG